MSYSTELRNAKLAANASVIGNGGRLEIYAGAKPTAGGPEGQILAVFVLGSPFAPAPVNGVQSPTIPAPTTGLAIGVAGWARITKADGVTWVMDRTVGTSGAHINLNSLSITLGGDVSISNMTIADGNQ